MVCWREEIMAVLRELELWTREKGESVEWQCEVGGGSQNGEGCSERKKLYTPAGEN